MTFMKCLQSVSLKQEDSGLDPEAVHARTLKNSSRGSKMARSDRQERPVSDEEFESMPERISSHFDRVRDLVEQETDDSDA